MVTSAGECWVRLQKHERLCLVAAGDRASKFVRCKRRGRVRAASHFPATLLLFLNDGDDFVVASLAGEPERTRGLAVRIDALASVGPMLHQQAHHLGRPIQHCVVQRSMFVVACHVHVRQLGAGFEEGTRLLQIPVMDRLGESLHGGPVHISLELGPTVEAVAPRQHELGIVQGEFRRVGSPVVRVHLRDGRSLPLGERLQQFLRLPLELIEIGVLAKLADGWSVMHNELLSWPARLASAVVPGVRLLGQKRVH